MTNSDHPEGLYLGLTPSDTLGIFDAGDYMWIEFGDGGHDDPIRWHNQIVKDTCESLGVTVAFDDEGNEVGIDALLFLYNGHLDFVE